MSEILSIEKLRELAHPIIEIPGFDNTSTIKIRVQKPKLMYMAANGKIPNHLMSVASTLINGKREGKQKKDLTEEETIKEINNAMDLYCRACLVEPSYEEMKEILTDAQRSAIFSWGLGEVQVLDSFRDEKGNGTTNNSSKKVSKETK